MKIPLPDILLKIQSYLKINYRTLKSAYLKELENVSILQIKYNRVTCCASLVMFLTETPENSVNLNYISSHTLVIAVL